MSFYQIKSRKERSVTGKDIYFIDIAHSHRRYLFTDSIKGYNPTTNTMTESFPISIEDIPSKTVVITKYLGKVGLKVKEV